MVLEELNPLLNILNKFRFEIGIFDSDSNTMETATIFNLDGSTSTVEMSLSDIMYFTEYGTITLPAKRVLERIGQKIKYEFPDEIKFIIEQVLNHDWQDNEIKRELERYNTRINTYIIPLAINEILSSDNTISGILGQEEDTHYVFDLRKLKKFIKSCIFFAN